MLLTLQDLNKLKLSINKARQKSIDSNYCDELYCNTKYIDPQTNEPYRLEPKPKARKHVLEKNGFKTEEKDGVLHARIPLGVHGFDNLAIDLETEEVVCKLCKQNEKEQS
jgi:hypothetical protein